MVLSLPTRNGVSRAYCLLPTAYLNLDLMIGLTECLRHLPYLRSPVCEHITPFLLTHGHKICHVLTSKCPTRHCGVLITPPSLKQLGRLVVKRWEVRLSINSRLRCDNSNLTLFYNFLLFFLNISILYSLSNHLSRRILIFFLKGGVEICNTQTGLPHTLVKVLESNQPLSLSDVLP